MLNCRCECGREWLSVWCTLTFTNVQHNHDPSPTNSDKFIPSCSSFILSQDRNDWTVNKNKFTSNWAAATWHIRHQRVWMIMNKKCLDKENLFKSQWTVTFSPKQTNRVGQEESRNVCILSIFYLKLLQSFISRSHYSQYFIHTYCQ